MLKINMFSSADKVKGQGVGSAYLELIKMLKTYHKDTFDIKINSYTKADISHYHTVDPFFYVSTFFKKRRGTTIGYVHFLPETLEGSLNLFKPFQRIFNWYLLSFYRRMDQLVVVNPTFIPKLEAIGVPRDRIEFIPNFVSKDDFYEETKETQAKWRTEYGYKKEDLVIMGAGQIQKRKGVDDFIQLAKDNPDVAFIWAGGFSFGKMTDGYEEYQAVYDNPPKNLRFTGIVDRKEIMRYLNVADVFFLPSYNELFPMCILEAFNCGTPVMLRDLELYHSIIKDQYLSTVDIEGMQEQIEGIQRNPEILERYKEKSLASAKVYSEERTAEIWLDYYTKSAKK